MLRLGAERPWLSSCSFAGSFACMRACMHASRALASLEVQEVQESQAAEKKLRDAEKKLREKRVRIMYAAP